MESTPLHIFSKVVDAPPGERVRLLAELCRGDEVLAHTVQRMLLADENVELGVSAPGLLDLDAVRSALDSPPTDAPLPTHIGPYAIIRIIGSGGMGIVYEAEESHPRRRLALKVLHADLHSEAVRGRFRQEVQTVSDLRLPSIPRVFAAGEVAGSPWLAMELIDGVPVHHASAARSLPDRVGLLAHIAQTIGAVHTSGVLHCDLKPNNVLIDQRGTPWILDFGLASTTRQPGDRAGTPKYMAPEQRRGEPLDVRADIYALGVMGWESCAGRPAPYGASDLPVDLVHVLRKAVEQDREDRYDSAQAFAADLRRVLAWRPVLARPHTARYVAERFLRRHRRAARLVAIGALLAGAIGGVAIGGSSWSLHRAEQARETAARQRLARIRVQVEQLESRGERQAAMALFDTFLRLPEHRDTSVMTEALVWRGERLLARGYNADALDALGEAYVKAVGPSDQKLALLSLADWFAASGQWDDLERVVDHMGPWSDAPEVAAHRRRVVLGKRRLQGMSGVVGAWSKAQRLTSRAYRVEIDPWRPNTLVTLEQAPGRVTEYAVGDGVKPARSWPIDHEISWDFAFPRTVAGHDGWMVGSTVDRQPFLWSVRGDTQTFPSEASAVLLAAGTLGGTETTLIVGMGPGDRGLRGLRRVGDEWTSRRNSPQTDAVASDVNDLVAYDLDNDGVDEAIIAQGPWQVYDVRVLVQRDDALEVDATIELGFVQHVQVMQTPAGPRIIALKHSRYPNQLVLGAQTPTGSADGVYVLAWEPGQLRVVQHLAFPLSSAQPNFSEVVVGDVDGDGLDDVVASIQVDKTDYVWPLMGSAEGLVAGDLIGHMHALAAKNVDDDPADELVVRLADDEHHTWVLGVGDETLPAVQGTSRVTPATSSFVPSDPALARVAERVQLLATLSLYVPAARALLRAGRVSSSPDDERGALLRAGELLLAGGSIGQSRTVLRELVDSSGQMHDDVRRVATNAALMDRDLTAAAVLEPDAAVRKELALGLGWSDLEAAGRAVDMMPREHWRIDDNEGARWFGDRFELDVFQNQDVLASAALDWSGGRLGLEASLDLHALEFGAVIKISLVPPDGDSPLALYMEQGGGGIDTSLGVGCRYTFGQGIDHAWPQRRRGAVHERVHIRMDWLDSAGAVLCVITDSTGAELVRQEAPITVDLQPGRWQLTISGANTVYPRSMAQASVTVRDLVVVGAEPVAPTELNDPPQRQGNDALERLWRLRRHPGSLQSDRTDDGQLDLVAYEGAWRDAVSSFDVGDLREGMLSIPLETLDGSKVEHLNLLLGRAMVLAERGQLRAASDALDVMLSSPHLADAQGTFTPDRPRAMRVHLARQLGDEQAERLHTDAFVAAQPDPDVALRRLELWISAVATR